MDATVLSDGIPVEPVVLEIVKKCRFKAKPCSNCGRAKSHPSHRKQGGTCTFKRQLKCANCNKPKADRDHLGAPESLNILGSGNPQAYISLKTRWEELFVELLEESGLPKGLERVVVEGEVTFHDRQPRDEGNIRFIVEKALGDALTAGGWLDADTFFPVRRYSFGNLEGRCEPGASALRLMLFPTSGSGGCEFANSRGLDTHDVVDTIGLSVDTQVPGGDAEDHGVSRVACPELLAQLG